MEVDVVINGQLAENAAIGEDHQRDHKVDRRTLSENKKYHVFFCYRDVPNDKKWVKETVQKLENDSGFICCDHERDFLAGTEVIRNITYGITNSEKVVCVLSKEGLNSGYLEWETEMALNKSIDNREKLLIPVLLDDCEIPYALKLLTRIDARKEMNETTWLPKLIAAIESKAEYSFFKGRKAEKTKDTSENQPTYYFRQLCSIGTTVSCKHCSLQNTSKYFPRELDEVVPVETINNIKRDLLDAPRIKCKQKCCCFSIGLLILFMTICAIGLSGDLAVIIVCADTTTESKDDCFSVLYIIVPIEISIGICLGVLVRCYYKVPKSFDKKITEYNTELIKNGILITLVYTQQWKRVYIVFYMVSLDSCKQYIIFHLREDRKPERETFLNISETETQHDADGMPSLSRSENEDLAQATKVYPQNVGLRQKDDDQGSTIVNLSDLENKQECTPNSQFSQGSDLGNIENVAMTLFLKYAHEYLRLVFNGKISNRKEDRHIPDCTCLCQYIEKTDKQFRKLVDKNKIIHDKIKV